MKDKTSFSDNTSSFEQKVNSDLAARTPLQKDSALLALDIITKEKRDTVKKETLSVAGRQKVKEKQKPFKKSFFYSIVAGPDLSTIKYGQTSKAGYSIGVMLGYRLSKRISVQAGALWDRKSYYAKGGYFDTSRLKLPMHTKILDGKGSCNMIEIPVNIQYDFITKSRHSWFISAGLSGYLMKKENYNLNVERYNQFYNKDYDYKNSSKDWFSIMNLSAGYQRQLGKQSSFSIAPYVKLPLKGVGIGKLPISSTGIYFSVTRSLK